ncbi:MAG: tyrosine protein phosphatase yvh1 [Thelocarpon impressellum]|nr:MAG: tyrosine protein phosphatase yvh1 [Thelocarpon impressellum]
MALDRVPGGDELYIGGIFSLHRKEALKQAKITHVLSVMRLPLGQDIFAPYKHMVVEVDDVEDENLLQHFNSANTFIHGGLSGGGGVLVHCAMGKSRSATCVIAYTMQKYRTTPQEALFRLRQAREICEPNDGFMEQLNLYHKMRCPNDVEEQTLYRRWLYKRHLDVSLACGQAPDVVRFEDEHAEDLAVSEAGEADLELRCRKCRRTLATSHYLAHHPSMTEDEDEDEDKDKDKDKDKDDAEARFPEHGDTTSVCAHYFLQPLSWMRPELEQGKLDGDEVQLRSLDRPSHQSGERTNR